MGSLNCVRGKCSLGFTADRSGDPLLELKVAHNAVAGVSRTDAQIMVMVGRRLSYSVSSSRNLQHFRCIFMACRSSWYFLIVFFNSKHRDFFI